MALLRKLLPLLLLSMTSSALAAPPPQPADTVSLRGVISEDTYTAGGTVFCSAQIQGDLVASGGTVLMDGQVDNDALLFAGTISITGPIGDDIRAMGGNITLNSQVGGDAVIAGGSLSLGSRSNVKGRALLAGGSILVAGDIQHGLNAAGGRIVIAGHIHGDVDLEGGEIEIQKGARIDGNLTYRSEQEASIDPGAQIQGSISYQPSEWQRHEGPGNWFFMFTLALAAIVFYLLFPAYSFSSLTVMRGEFWKSLGFGVVVLLVIPFLAGFSMVIVLGMWLGLALLALYLVALLIGSILGMTLVGDQLARWLRWQISSRGRRVVSILVAFVLVALLQWVPFLGGLLTFLILLLGLGAGTIVLFRHYIASPSTGTV
jgi:cytoskeletal protein CcmA (bactofilin family)